MTTITTKKTSGPAAAERPVLSVRGLRVTRTGDGTPIVAGLDIDIAPGESVAFVGESGSGKSVTARSLIGLLPRTLRAEGRVELEGRDLLQQSEREWRGIRGRKVGMVMQDPFTTLNPIMRCSTILGESLPDTVGRGERRAEVLRRLAEVGIEDPTVAQRYPFQLSGGMRQRVGIAAALARDPEILIADEPTTALDATTQRGILALLKRIQAARRMSLVLITHDLRVAFAMCDRVFVLYAGAVVEVAQADALDEEPLHPYSSALLLSEPALDRRMRELVTIPGSVPAPGEIADQCVFAPRCSWADDSCRAATPPLREVAPGRWSACVRLDEIRADLRERRSHAAAGVSEEPTSTDRKPVVRADGVSKRFGAVVALEDVSMSVAEGECVGIVGESGSGKTTLARTLVGLENPTAGRVTIDGVEVTDWSAIGRADLQRVRGNVQMVFQDPYSSLNPKRRIGWSLAEAVRIHNPEIRDVKGEVARLLESVGLSAGAAGKRPSALSGGMRQRVAIARALAARPRLLVCDESVSALDVSVQAQILNLLSRLRDEQGLGILLITHDLSVVRQVADRVYVMHRGKVVESGPTGRVMADPGDSYTSTLLAAAPSPAAGWLDA